MIWMVIAVSFTALGLLAVLHQCRGLPDLPTRFLLLAIWARYALQAFPAQTVNSEFAGFSIVALAAIMSAFCMTALAQKSLYLMRNFGPIYAFFTVVLFSSVLSNSIDGLMRDTMKWLYFLGVLILTYRAVKLFGLDRIARALMWTTLTSLSLQVASVIVGERKLDPDGSVSYIGGYIHEGLFSYIPLTLIFLVAMVPGKIRPWQLALVVLGVWSITMANYRTSLIAALPLLALLAWQFVTRPWGPRGKLVIGGTLGIALLLASPFLPSMVPDRFDDIVQIVSKPEVLIRPPAELSFSEKRLLSGRVLLWAEYFAAIERASSAEQIIGQGAHSYVGRMRLFAHNTFISYLFEFGVLGVILILMVLVGNFFKAIKIPDADLRQRLVMCHVGFFALNLAQMPLWSTEGTTLYALILAATWTAYRPDRAAALPEPRHAYA